MVMGHVVRIHNAITDSEHNMTKGPITSNYSNHGARFDGACFGPSSCLKVLHQTQAVALAVAAIWVLPRDNVEIICLAVVLDIGERVLIATLVKVWIIHKSGGYKGMGNVRGATVRILRGAFFYVIPAHDENHEQGNSSEHPLD